MKKELRMKVLSGPGALHAFNVSIIDISSSVVKSLQRFGLHMENSNKYNKD